MVKIVLLLPVLENHDSMGHPHIGGCHSIERNTKRLETSQK